MAQRLSTLSRNGWNLWPGLLILAVVLSIAGLLGLLTRPQQTAPDPPSRAVVQALATTEPSATPQLATATNTTDTTEPTPIQSTNTPEPTATVEPTTAEPTATVIIVTPQVSPILPSPTAGAVLPDPNLLPSGARYGERRPNIPKRIVRIASPDIKLDTPVYEVYAPKSVWEVADYAGGHHFNSMNPGQGGNIVLSGHNNWHGEVFRYLELLKPGNTINVWTLDGTKYTYIVQELKKLKEAGVSMAQRLENARVMDPTPDEQLTLITCWPYKTFTHRIIVIAKPEVGGR